MFNNREWAAALWLAVTLLWGVSKPAIRASLKNVFRAAFRLSILVPLTLMLGYVGLEVWIGTRLSLWQVGLLKGTVLWVVASGLVMFVNVSTSEVGFYRRTILGTIGVTVFVEFFMNMVVFNIFVELLLQPLLTILILLAVVAGLDQRHHQVKKLIDGGLAIIGFTLLAIVARDVYGAWHDLEKHSLLLDFALPVWLTVGFLPGVYILSLYANYDAAFRGISYWTSDRKTRIRAKLALVTKLHIKAAYVQAFNRQWARKIASASSFAAAREVLDEFKAVPDLKSPPQ